jgi:hypothetical protein
MGVPTAIPSVDEREVKERFHVRIARMVVSTSDKAPSRPFR